MSLLHFHAAIHPLPPLWQAGKRIALNGVEVDTIKVAPAAEATLFPITFDALFAEIAAWPRFFCEPDGSFVGVAGDDEPERWQLDGQLFDGGPGMLYVELRGSCPAAVLDRLLRVLGWPKTSVMFQMVLAGMLLGEEAFRRVAEHE